MTTARLKQLVESALVASGLYECAARLYCKLSPSRARMERALRKDFRARIGQYRRVYGLGLEAYPKTRVALLVGQGSVDAALLQLPLIAALRVSGHRVVVLFASPTPALEELYRGIGASGVEYIRRHLSPGDDARAASMLAECKSMADLLALEWRGAACGKYCAATYMRHTRKGDFDITDAGTLAHLQSYLSNSLAHAQAMSRIIERIRPDVVCFLDRGYTPDGELFDAAVTRDIDAITMNAAHRSGALMFKRYRRVNRDSHPASLSAASWKRLDALAWTREEEDRLLGELTDCYRSGSWYDEVGTQFGRRMADAGELEESLGLDPTRKTAAIFPHLFWDATFFWGRDLFENYEAWFTETLKAAIGNERLNWIIKVHPANIVKDRRDRHGGEHSEILAIKNVVSELPPHIKIMPADHPVSTLSLYSVIDYCVTVRGTVGLEAACFGVPVLTAGTGRYDAMGFTIDSDSPDDYLHRLSSLETVAAPDARVTSLARRYAWGIFFARPAPTSSISFAYGRDEGASLRVDIADASQGEIAQSSDVRGLAAWLESGDEDFLNPQEMQSSEEPVEASAGAGVG